jgi:hypothetical protein
VRALAVALVAAASLAAPAASATNGPSFAFGRGGGNIMPLDVRIAASGRVTVDGTFQRTLTKARLQTLLRLALAQRFFALPRKIVCPGQLPDFATLYVTVRNGSGAARTVTQRGNCNKRFIRVYAALQSAVGSTP